MYLTHIKTQICVNVSLLWLWLCALMLRKLVLHSKKHTHTLSLSLSPSLSLSLSLTPWVYLTLLPQGCIESRSSYYNIHTHLPFLPQRSALKHEYIHFFWGEASGYLT